MNKVSSFINHKQSILNFQCDRELTFAIPINGGEIHSRLMQKNKDVVNSIESIFQFQKGTIKIQAHSDEPCAVHFISPFDKIFSHFKCSASFYNTDQKLFQVTSSLKSKYGNFSLVPSGCLTIQGTPNSFKEIKPSMLDIHLCMLIRHKPERLHISFEVFRASHIMFIETFFKKPFVSGINLKYNFQKRCFPDANFVLSWKTPKNARLTFNGSIKTSSLKFFVTKKFSEKFSAGALLQAQNIGHGLSLLAQAAGNIKIDEGSSLRLILSTDVSAAADFSISYQDFLNMKFSAKSTLFKSDVVNNFGGLIQFDILNRDQ